MVLFRKYKLDRSENFDEFLKALGVNMIVRKMASTVTSTVQLVDEGSDLFSFNTTSTFRSQSLKFKIGEEFDEETMDGRKVKCVVTFDGNKMIQQQLGNKGVRIVREFTEEELITTCTVGDVTAKRWFKSFE
ncbi:unnamed protein product [Diamesa serratosioi]